MKRRYFLTTLIFGLGNLKFSWAKSLVKHTNEICINGMKCELKEKRVMLPKNPYPFKDILLIDITDAAQEHKLYSEDSKIMGRTKAFKLSQNRQYTLQYSGPDIGWIVM